MLKRFQQALCFLLGWPLRLDVEGAEWVFDPRQRLLASPENHRLIRGAWMLNADTGEKLGPQVPDHAKEVGQLMAWAEDRVYSWWRAMYRSSTRVDQFEKNHMAAEVMHHRTDGRYFVVLKTWNPMAMEHDRVCEFDEGDVQDMVEVMTLAAGRVSALNKA
jgi:hypothetical protein